MDTRTTMLNRRSGLLLLLGLLAFACAFLTTSGSAHAYSSSQFCYGTSAPGQPGYLAPGARCVDSRRVRHRYVWVQASPYPIGTGDFCVGAKENSNGSGHDTTPFGCAYTSQTDHTYSGPYGSPGGDLGYATVINRTSQWNIFWGYMEWYP